MIPSDVEIKIEDVQNKKTFDITKAIESFEVTFIRKGQASKFQANFHNVNKKYISKGSRILIKIGGENFFKGYFSENEIDNWWDTTMTCYDQINYLAKNKASYNICDTATGILKKIASDYGLTVGKCDETSFIVGNGNNFHSGESLLEIILHALRCTLVETQYLYNLIDDFGELRIVSPANMIANHRIQIGYNVFNFRYKGSINQKTYNRVRLYWSNDAGMDVIGQAADDPESQAKWGILGFYSRIDEMAASSTVAGAQNMARTILAAYNREFKSIHIESLGDPSVRGGSMVYVDLGKIDGIEEVNGYQLVDNVTHRFENNKHTMELDVLDIDTLKR